MSQKLPRVTLKGVAGLRLIIAATSCTTTCPYQATERNEMEWNRVA